MITPNDFHGFSDNDIIEQMIATRTGNTVVIEPRRSDVEPERDWWLIDRAILLTSHTTVILRNCRIKLSDKCRDNFFRSANCGEETSGDFPKEITDIHIIGEGLSILEGADHPRSTGDGGKLLGCPVNIDENPFNNGRSFGTDAGAEGVRSCGGWQNVGILFANVRDATISNIRIVEPHAWAISLEYCSHVRIEKIDFKCSCIREIDGIRSYCMNQDGVDIRRGCHDIFISDITGVTGDDVVALTAINNDPNRPVTYEYPQSHKIAGHTEIITKPMPGRSADIENVIIRNVMGYSPWCCCLRLLALGTKIRNVVIDTLIDTAPSDEHWCTLLIGEGPGCCYGDVFEDSISNVTINNVICNSQSPIGIPGYLKDSIISNVINRTEHPTIYVALKDGMKNVLLSNVQGETSFLNR